MPWIIIDYKGDDLPPIPTWTPPIQGSRFVTHQKIDAVLVELRRQRDEAAAQGDHANALIINDRINDLKVIRTSPMVEQVMKQFESALVRRKAYGKPSLN